MDRRRPNERIRSFFKVFFPESCTNSLKIPSAFSSFMQGQLPKRTILRDRNGKTWSVKVEKVENNFFFVDGWPEFVEDNSMQLGEFLVFQFDGHGVYDVKLFGHSNCEKNIEEDTTKVKEEEGEKEDKEEEREEEEEETNEVEEEEEDEGESYSNATASLVDAEYIPEDNDTDEEQEQDVEDEKTAKFHKGASESKRPAVDPYGYDIFQIRICVAAQKSLFCNKNKGQEKRCTETTTLVFHQRSSFAYLSVGSGLQNLILGRMADFGTMEDGEASAGSILLE